MVKFRNFRNLHGRNTDAAIPKIPKFDQFWNFRNAGRRQRSSSYPKARALGCTVWAAPSRPGFPNHSPAPRGCFPAPPRKGGPTGSQAKNQKLPKTGALSNHFQNSQHPSRNSCNGRAFSFNVLAGIGSRGRESLNIVLHNSRSGATRKFRGTPRHTAAAEQLHRDQAAGHHLGTTADEASSSFTPPPFATFWSSLQREFGISGR